MPSAFPLPIRLVAFALAVSGAGTVLSEPAAICPAAVDNRLEPADIALQGRRHVGDEVSVTALETPHPYRFDAGDSPRLVHREELHLPGATYIAPYFSRFDLAPGDHVIVRSPDGSRTWRYEGEGKPGLGRTHGFWGIPVPGDRLVVELHADGHGSAWGYRIDKVARGFVDLAPRAVCGEDDKRNAACYQSTQPAIYQASRAVTRLLVNGTHLCTGWLVGSEGHVMTNQHCIGNALEAMNTAFEFMAEGACSEPCGFLGCTGSVAASHGTLIQANEQLDYSLIRLPVNPTPSYGFLRLRPTRVTNGEAIFIPQHPGGRGKEIAVESSHPNDIGGTPRISILLPYSARYFADTEFGSSGSPVIARTDHCVVALHNGTFGCEHPTFPGNLGSLIDLIIADLGTNLPAGALPVNGSCLDPDAIFANGFQ